MLSVLLAACLISPFSPDAPRLTVVISIDQFRADYVSRFADLYLPPNTAGGVGGFRWLSEKGANFVNAQYSHVPTETGPGHAVIGTGSTPGVNGIVGNDWFVAATGKTVYCVSDPGAKDVLTGKESYSPKNLLATTFCDELDIASSGRSRLVAIAIKDRASILMAGRRADDVLWFNSDTGSWTTSDFYRKDGKLPEWVVNWNAKKIPDAAAGRTWTTTVSAEALGRTSIPEKPSIRASFGTKFPHKLTKGSDARAYYSDWTRTPWANEYVFSTAEEAIRARELGKDDIPDVLLLNLSTNDYIGHAFGPDSPEVMEISVQTDRQLSKFFQFLQANVPGGLESTLIIVTADHGVLPMPEELTKSGLPGGRVNLSALKSKIVEAVRAEYGAQEIVRNFGDMTVHLDEEQLPPEINMDEMAMFVRDELRKQPEVFAAFTKWELLEQKLPSSPVSEMTARSFYAPRYGDVVYFFKPGYYPGIAGGTGHGSPWIYDRAVPLLMAGKRVASGLHLEQCGPEDIAATVSAAIGIISPSGSVGRAIGIK